MTSTNKMITVLNRHKETEAYDPTRIRDVIQWAVDGLDANPLELEARFDQKLYDGIQTESIQDYLTACAVELCSKEEPDWRIVAGRLMMWNRWQSCKKQRIDYNDPASILAYIQNCLGNNRYRNNLYQYSTKQLSKAIGWIVPERDLNFDYAANCLLTKRYLFKDELPQVAFLVDALLLALPEYGEYQRMEFAKRVYDQLSTRRISLATPLLANLRIPHGNASSCFIIALEDNLESIYRELTNAARISKNGGGIGVYCSYIRATGSDVMGRPNSSGGVIPWVKLFNDTAIAVNQGGRRAGAITVALDTWHLDLMEFLEVQAENGDQRRKAHDIFPQLVATDEFMERVDNNQDWYMFCPREFKQQYNVDPCALWGEEFSKYYNQFVEDCQNGMYQGRYKVHNAKQLYKLIVETQVTTGLPYVAFKDTINRANPNKHKGFIPCVNLCVESFSVVTPGREAHTCNLVSLVAGNINDREELEESCKVATRLLDNALDITTNPFLDSKTHNEQYRTIGVGVMGLADLMAKHEIKYSDLTCIDDDMSGDGHRARTFINNWFENIAYFCTYESAILAELRGPYKAYKDSEWSVGKLLGSKTLDEIKAFSFDPKRWEKLAATIKRTGIRNSHITAIAPNTSSSLMMGCSASILPTYSRFFMDKWNDGYVPIAPTFIKDKYWYYEENKHVDQRNVTELVSIAQRWIDTGISMELVFNVNDNAYHCNGEAYRINAKDIYETQMEAWEKGCKAIYYIRVIQKVENIDQGKKSCSACAG